MPGFDGTGPRGMGSMTGGGRGFCVVPVAGVTPRSFGRGCGRGRRNRFYASGLFEEEPKAVQDRVEVRR